MIQCTWFGFLHPPSCTTTPLETFQGTDLRQVLFVLLCSCWVKGAATFTEARRFCCYFSANSNKMKSQLLFICALVCVSQVLAYGELDQSNLNSKSKFKRYDNTVVYLQVRSDDTNQESFTKKGVYFPQVDRFAALTIPGCTFVVHLIYQWQFTLI